MNPGPIQAPTGTRKIRQQEKMLLTSHSLSCSGGDVGGGVGISGHQENEAISWRCHLGGMCINQECGW